MYDVHFQHLYELLVASETTSPKQISRGEVYILIVHVPQKLEGTSCAGELFIIKTQSL